MKDDEETRYNTIEKVIVSILKDNVKKKDVKKIIPLLCVKLRYRFGFIKLKQVKKEVEEVLKD